LRTAWIDGVGCRVDAGLLAWRDGVGGKVDDIMPAAEVASMTQ
jgi:hypothetical protein